MSEDKFKEYIHRQKPSIPDGENFMLELNSRLASVEGIKETVQRERQRDKSKILIALLTGLALGIIVEGFILMAPVTEWKISPETISLLKKWKLPILVIISGVTTLLSLYLISDKKSTLFD